MYEIGRYGSDEYLRTSLERYILRQPLEPRLKCPIPVVCLLVGGNEETIDSVLEYVMGSPPIPVIVVEDSGGAAELITFVFVNVVEENGSLDIGPSNSKLNELLTFIQVLYSYKESKAELLVSKLLNCFRRKSLFTIFSKNEMRQLDKIIVSTFGYGHWSNYKQLHLALAWNRFEIASFSESANLSCIQQFYNQAFEDTLIASSNQQFSSEAIEDVLMAGLMLNRVDFVRVLFQKNVLPPKFLTEERLLELYNCELLSPKILKHLMSKIKLQSKCDGLGKVKYIVKILKGQTLKCSEEPYTLEDIGLLLNQLMGGGYQSPYIRYKQKRF